MLAREYRQIAGALGLAALVDPRRTSTPCLLCRNWRPWYPQSLGEVAAARVAADAHALELPRLHLSSAVTTELAALAEADPTAATELGPAQVAGVVVCLGKACAIVDLQNLLRAEGNIVPMGEG